MIDLTGIQLFCFDVDGTLVRPKSGGQFRKSAEDWEWLPGRLERLRQLKADGKFIRFVTNQGGVAFDLLKEHEIQNEFVNMAEEIGYERWHNITHVCFTHPKAKLAGYLEDSHRRKPNPGMIQEAMLRENVKPEQTLMVGDRDEDKGAAKAAGAQFAWASDFFVDEIQS